MKSNRTMLAVFLNTAACAGVLLTAATPPVGAQEEKATASTAAAKDDSGRQAGTAGKTSAVAGHSAPVMLRSQAKPAQTSPATSARSGSSDSAKWDSLHEKNSVSLAATADDTGKQAGTSGKAADKAAYSERESATAESAYDESSKKDSKKADTKKAKKGKKAKRDSTGTEAGTSAKK
jgi:hypothetical protein